MGFQDTTRAVRHEATRRAKDVGGRVEPAVRKVAPEKVEAVAAVLREFGAKLDHAATSTRSARDRAVARTARTRAGNAVGTFTNQMGRQLAEVPVLSLPRAVMEERHGVNRLTGLVLAAPDDPVPAIQLAEALKLLERDSRLYLAIRTLWSPYALLVAESTKVAQALGNGQLARPAEAMLRRAYALAVARLRADRSDAQALHVVARVFQATGHHEGGLKPCTIAAERSRSLTTEAQVLFTLSCLQQRSGDKTAAGSSATRAISLGCSLGWQVLADLTFAEEADTSTAERIALYQDMVDRIDPNHERAYRGFVRPKSGDLWRAVSRDQTEKATHGYRRLADNYGRLQKRVEEAVRRRR